MVLADNFASHSDTLPLFAAFRSAGNHCPPFRMSLLHRLGSRLLGRGPCQVVSAAFPENSAGFSAAVCCFRLARLWEDGEREMSCMGSIERNGGGAILGRTQMVR